MVSRTFTLSIEQLPQDIRDAVALSYLLYRGNNKQQEEKRGGDDL